MMEVKLIDEEVRAIINKANHHYGFYEWKEAYTLYKQVEHLSMSGHVYYRLGVMYHYGYCIPQDIKMANFYFKLALEQLKVSVLQGDSEAYCDLGYMYDCGCLVEKNPELAFNYYKIAADKGLQRAQFNLGLLYNQGVGVSKDAEKSLHYFKLAADQGYVNALCHMASLYKSGECHLLKKDPLIAFKFLKQAAEAGYTPAISQLSDFYYLNGIDICVVKFATKCYLEIVPKNESRRRLTELFRSQDDFLRKGAASHLADIWPSSNPMLNKMCQDAVLVLWGIREEISKEKGMNFPEELFVLITKLVIIAWPKPYYHYVHIK